MQPTEKTDTDIGEAAECEAKAHLAIVRALKPLSLDERARVLRAIGRLLEAETEVPGILKIFANSADR
jgi:hypothetical protein